ncbi:MAG: hypothetical protein LBU53_06970 [Zoogloeaceae bacterium]|nr:hypothetical protein [Zoogloeaceae bacterium]
MDLHDSNIKSMRIDYAKKVVEIDMDFGEKSVRTPVTITFNEVSSISETSDLVELNKNARFGNICYWRPRQAEKITHIYLVDGCISIRAESVTMRRS